MDLNTYSLLIERLYDAATDAKSWPASLRTVADAFHGHAASLIFRDMSTMEGHWISTLEPATETEYFNDWRDNNILVGARQDWRPGAVETDRDWMPKADLLRSDFHAGFMRPRDIYAVMRLLVRKEGTVQPSLTIARHCGAGDFDEAEVAIARRLIPHVQHAICISDRLGGTRVELIDGAEALDRLVHPIMVLDDMGAPIHVNRAADALVAKCDGVTLTPAGPRAATPTLTAQLSALVARAAGRAGDIPESGTMTLARPSGKRPLAVVVLPMRGPAAWLLARHRMVLVSIIDPEAPSMVPVERLMDLFRLTQSEARVARELLGGHDVAEIARRTRSSVNTVRTHLARLMAKTETHRQSELVRVLASLTLLGVAESAGSPRLPAGHAS